MGSEPQQEEVQVLEATFCQEGEFTITQRQEDLLHSNEAVEVQCSLCLAIPASFGASLNLSITLPYDYPTSRPSIVASIGGRIDSVDQQVLSRPSLQDAVRHGLDTCSEERPILSVVHDVLDWINDVMDSSIKQRTTVDPASSQRTERLLVWFHHIRSRTKRLHILKWAKELGINGLCAIGKPGLIVAEGNPQELELYSERLRGQNWKKMSVLSQEEMEKPWFSAGFQEMESVKYGLAHIKSCAGEDAHEYVLRYLGVDSFTNACSVE